MFIVANCCLTNFFNQRVCLGEAFLRRANNAGAVAYIGGTNSTYWKEDFYWSVGLRTNISNNMSTNYNSSKLGVYDRLFHTHSEAFADYAITAGAMPFFGCMTVQNASSSYLSGDAATTKKYYWEIYELMGDPTMMPWLGKAQDLTNFSVQSHQNDDDDTRIDIDAVLPQDRDIVRIDQDILRDTDHGFDDLQRMDRIVVGIDLSVCREEDLVVSEIDKRNDDEVRIMSYHVPDRRKDILYRDLLSLLQFQ